MTTVTVPDLLDELDLDAEPACQYVDGCDRSAAWRVRAFCGCMLLLCRPCWSAVSGRLEDREVELAGRGFVSRCQLCGTGARFWPPDLVSQVFVSVVPM